MCRECIYHVSQLNPKVRLCIYSKKPGETYYRINKKGTGCTRLYYSDITGILKFNCKDFKAYKFWFPTTQLREHEFLFNTTIQNIKSIFADDSSELDYFKIKEERK